MLVIVVVPPLLIAAAAAVICIAADLSTCHPAKTWIVYLLLT